MPPIRTTARSCVFTITRHDYEHHTDHRGRLELIEIHGSLDSANKAARSYFRREEMKAGKVLVTHEHEEENLGYHGWCYVAEDRRDHFMVKVA